ncbi:hypothetical protein IWW55_000374 [Coemansia sp. RSA 2706]|nr:hypothetical protein IWW55_000374 [Coemansia sp. RSA 2706]
MDNMVTYSDGVIALHSCLAKDGVTERSLNELHQLLDGKTMDDSGAILNELVSDVKENSKVQAALEMALQRQSVPATSIAEQPGTRRIKDGKYIITDLNQFKAAQRFHDLADPAIPLVPKYEL